MTTLFLLTAVVFLSAFTQTEGNAESSNVFGTKVLIKLEDTTNVGKELESKMAEMGNRQCANSSNIGCESLWSYCESGQCKCADVPHDIIQCSNQENVSVLQTYCITYNENEDLTEVGHCIRVYGHGKFLKPYFKLPNNKSEVNQEMCGKFFNRNGTLCAKCRDAFYPLVYSFDSKCVKCPGSKSNWWKFVLAAFLPLTLFYFVIVLFRLNITSSQLYGFVYISQVLLMPAAAREITSFLSNHERTMTAARFLGSLYGIWNLDFFRMTNLGICLDIGTLEMLALDLAVGMYPLFLITLSYVLIKLYDRNFCPVVTLWKPFRAVFNTFNRNWEIKTSLVDAFATFFLLTNVKFLSVSFDLLIPVQVYQLNSSGHYTYSWRLYYDATVTYCGPRHLPYIITAIAILLCVAVFPIALLIVYPFRWFQKCLGFFPIRWYVLHTFVDSFQGCYKDGTEPGTRDCRWFASVFFIARIFGMLIDCCVSHTLYFSFASMLLVLVVILLMLVQPFKQNVSHYASSISVFLLILALWYVCANAFIHGPNSCPDGQSLSLFFLVATFVVSALPLVCVSVITLQWIYTHRRFGKELIQRQHIRRQGYITLQ